MAVYRFKVSFEDYEDIYREIEIKSDQSFFDLHESIQQSIQFDGTQESSFFMSTDHWIKGEEISTQVKITKQGKETKLMKKAILRNYILDPHQKIYYVIDGVTPWTFHIELVRILPAAEMTAVYPKIKKIVGDAPRQYVSTVAPPVLDEDNVIIPDEEVISEVDEVIDDSAEFDEEGTKALEGEEVADDVELDDVELSGDEEMEEEV
jgi:hypothetical protein